MISNKSLKLAKGLSDSEQLELETKIKELLEQIKGIRGIKRVYLARSTGFPMFAEMHSPDLLRDKEVRGIAGALTSHRRSAHVAGDFFELSGNELSGATLEYDDGYIICYYNEDQSILCVSAKSSTDLARVKGYCQQICHLLSQSSHKDI
jgi:predicted regulator of Ras-like GTPase activity (Roadblock/LC7/MglB family)